MTRLVSAPLVVLLGLGLSLSPAAAQDHQRAPVPGTVDAHVTQATIHATICQRGYTAQVRPPRKVTDTIKRRLANGLPSSPQDYELDHLIPLGLGGHPRSAKPGHGGCRPHPRNQPEADRLRGLADEAVTSWRG